MASAQSQIRVPAVAQALKAIGIVLVLIAVVDFSLLAIPPSAGDVNWLDWRVEVISQIIDRGVIPLLGLALISFGIWITSRAGQRGPVNGSLLLVTLVLAAILGLTYIGLSGYHFREARLASAAATRQINEQAQTAESELDTRFEQLDQEIDLLTSILESGGPLPEEVDPSLIEAFEQNPQVLEQRRELARKQELSQIRQQQLTARQEVRQRYRELMFRIPTSGVLLACGYLILAWMGLSELFLRRR
jgi:hypothetical protein